MVYCNNLIAPSPPAAVGKFTVVQWLSFPLMELVVSDMVSGQGRDDMCA